VPQADVVVVGAGLAGLTAAIALADAGARVEVVARGHAATHWTAGGFDVAGFDGARTSAEGIRLLAERPGHPYGHLGADVAAALASLRATLAEHGLAYVGELDDPLRSVPTAIGGTRRVAILPAAQAYALAPWQPDERLVVCGIEGFKDFWPAAIATSLRRASVWGGGPEPRPAAIDAVLVALPDLEGRRNLNALVVARRFDDPAWRAEALERIAAAIDRRRTRGSVRIAFPAVLGSDDHAAVLDAAARTLPGPIFEVPLVSPSIPGVRLYRAFRAAFRARGGRMVLGEPVVDVQRDGQRVTAVAMAAATRQRVIRTESVVLATGGIAGGGLIGRADGRIVEPILDLPVEAPPLADWLADDPFDPRGHPLEAAGVRTTSDLRPVDANGDVVFENVVVAGSLLAGQRYLVERCGDGVAIASGARAAAVLGRGAPPRAIAAGGGR
jgi:glycerol-3-phosphate dehydrogenase subunit B